MKNRIPVYCMLLLTFPSQVYIFINRNKKNLHPACVSVTGRFTDLSGTKKQNLVNRLQLNDRPRCYSSGLERSHSVSWPSECLGWLEPRVTSAERQYGKSENAVTPTCTQENQLLIICEAQLGRLQSHWKSSLAFCWDRFMGNDWICLQRLASVNQWHCSIFW